MFSCYTLGFPCKAAGRSVLCVPPTVERAVEMGRGSRLLTWAKQNKIKQHSNTAHVLTLSFSHICCSGHTRSFSQLDACQCWLAVGEQLSCSFWQFGCYWHSSLLPWGWWDSFKVLKEVQHIAYYKPNTELNLVADEKSRIFFKHFPWILSNHRT